MLMLSDCFANVLERKHAEEALQETQRQLRISQKHEALGRLAGGIAHDFNNILGSIIGYADLSRVYLQKTDPVYEFQNKIALAGNQAKELVRQILLVARQQEREKVPIAAHLLVNDVIQLVRNATPKTIDVQAEVESKSPLVLVDPTQIHQVLLNLCTNANHAMREAGGTLRISVNDLLLDDRAIGPFSEVQPGHYVRIEVADTGHGMDSGTLEKIFDPYFTTKAPGEGTGLGLSVVKGIVESHGGVITVKSEPGKGSTFSVYLPRIPVPTVPVDVAVEDHLRGVERILLVEDEPMLLEVAKAILEYLGYTVTSSSQSPEALKLFHARKDEFDLVISDQTMPHITGINLAKAILSIRPDMPIILCSGYSEDIDKTSIAQAGISTFLLKPLSIANLGEAVRSVLDRRDGGRASTDPDGASADAGGD
jgi:nitrogen-specific signal transduction histidine kinase/ActR/RegA family two-component response regulator